MPELDLNIDTSQLAWPDETTHVFQPAGANPNVAWIPQTVGQWHLYAEGYREAAERVYESWRAQRLDYLVFPLVFLYRHYVELRLKQLLQSSARLLELPRDWQCNHQIDNLWHVLAPLLRRISPDGRERDLQNAERLVIELATRDPYSFEFRYPETREGRRHLADLERLDVVKFCDAMRKLSGFLEGASMQISVYLQDRPNKA
jgi:hypothetical protein